MKRFKIAYDALYKILGDEQINELLFDYQDMVKEIMKKRELNVKDSNRVARISLISSMQQEIVLLDAATYLVQQEENEAK